MGSQDDSRSRTESSFDDTDNIGDTQTTEQWPQKEILESRRTGWEIVNQRIIFHVDSDKVVETGGGKVEDTRDLLRVEKIGSFVPVLVISLNSVGRYNPHGLEIIRQEIKQRIPRKETQSKNQKDFGNRCTNRESSILRFHLHSWKIRAPHASSTR
jgi:sRNA-binding carbon storage regulator CsrA